MIYEWSVSIEEKLLTPHMLGALHFGSTVALCISLESSGIFDIISSTTFGTTAKETQMCYCW